MMYSFGTPAALDFVDEFVALARLIGLDAQFAMLVIARTAGLANVLAFGLGRLANCLAECHFQFADVPRFLNLVADRFQLQLILATDR
jgi:hypothetical protein